MSTLIYYEPTNQTLCATGAKKKATMHVIAKHNKRLIKTTIKLGSHELEVDVLVTENLHEGCLLGIDFLARCPMTKDLIEQLRHVACESSVHEVNEVHTFLIKSVNTSQ
jgi:hypothetical protein